MQGKTTLSPFILLSCLIGAGTAQATTCGEASHRLLELGDRYFELHSPRPAESSNTHNTSSSNGSAVHRIMSQLGSGTLRRGHGERVLCVGENQHQRLSRFKLLDVEQRRLADGSHALTAYAEDRAARLTRRARLELLPASHWVKDGGEFRSEHRFRRATRSRLLASGTRHGGRIDDLPAVADNAAETSNRRAGNSLVELVTHIEPGGKHLQIHEEIFVNGYRAEWTTWTLTP